MRRFRLVGLTFAALCATGAIFAASPPAAPHYYLNNLSNEIPQGVHVPTMSWGTLTLGPGAPSKEGQTTCESAADGFVENPAGGGAGKGQASSFLYANCDRPASCPTGAEIEFPEKTGKKVIEEPVVLPGGERDGVHELVIGESFPWPSELTEPEAKKIRVDTKGVVEIFGCQARKSVEGTPPLGDGDGDAALFIKKPTVCFTNPELGAKLQPLTQNGSQIGGPLTSKVTFDTPGSGHMLCKVEKEEGTTEEITVAGPVTGNIKTFTYEGEELILTH